MITDSIQKQLFDLTNKKFSIEYIKNYILPIIHYVVFSKKNKFIISGSQGIGKSTLLKILEKNIQLFFNKKVITLSLDNYYLSKLKRKELAKKIHPLLITRGVPGTHNIKELIKAIKNFDNSYYPYFLPIFDKLKDDVSKKNTKINFKADILILEGWCCGSTPIKKKYLHRNINKLEKNFDEKKIWRNYYNEMLKDDYYRLFSLFDKIIYLKTPSFKYVLNWRIKQEKMMKKNNNKIMTKNEMQKFILHYEKLTKWMMKTLPNNANLVIHIDNNQKIKKIIYS
tara:strand:- start:1874 stop:2722 length:849 start_codon:yes stop_codon:yes gene_type:complete